MFTSNYDMVTEKHKIDVVATKCGISISYCKYFPSRYYINSYFHNINLKVRKSETDVIIHI